MNEFAPSNKLLLNAAAILAIGLLLTAIGTYTSIAPLGVLGAGISGASVVLLFRLVLAKRNKKIAKEITIAQKDERQLKIYVHAGNFAFWVGMFSIIGMGVITNSKDPVVLFSPVLLLFIYLGAAFYYGRKF